MGASWTGEVGNEMVCATLMNGCKTEGKGSQTQICQAYKEGFTKQIMKTRENLGISRGLRRGNKCWRETDRPCASSSVVEAALVREEEELDMKE